MPSRKHQCMPCPFRDDCSFMRVDCEYDDQYDGSRFRKTDSDQYFSGMNRRHTIMDEEESVGSNSRASCMDRCQRRGDDQMDCQRRCESEESMSGRGRDVYHNRDYYGNQDYHGHRNFYGNQDHYGHRNFYGNRDYYGHRNFYGNHNFYGHRNFYHNSMHGEEYGMQRKCYNEYWSNTDCSGERSFHSIFKYDMSTCISGMEIYGDNDQWYYTPTSRCRDAACMDCEDFTSMPSRKYQCMPCSFRDNCSFMRVDCEYDDEYDGSRFGKTDSYYHGFGRNCGKYQYWNGYKCVSRRSNMYHEFFKAEESVGSSSSRYSCMERCQRDGYDYMACEMKCPSEESVSDLDSSSSDSKSSDNYQPSRRSSRKNCGRDQYWDGYRCVSRSGKEEVAYHSQTYSKHHGY